MYPNGSVVILSQAKSHGEGEDAIKLQAGVCGLVARGDRKKDGNHLYTVDFGAYGPWYCHHNELSGDDKEGWDEPATPWRDTGEFILEPISGPLQEESEETELARVSPPPLDLFDDLSEEEKEEAGVKHIDFEADLKKRMASLERGKCYDTP
jgi:hypothetical protein